MSHTLQLMLLLDVHVWMTIHTHLTAVRDSLKEQLLKLPQEDGQMYDILYDEWCRVGDAALKISEAIDYYYGASAPVRYGKEEGKISF